LALLRVIAGFAQRCQLVQAGALTEFGPTGLFGRPQLRGLTYFQAHPMDGVALPAGALAAVVLVGDEVDTLKRYGALRVLARLGRAHAFWPTAMGCDPDRGPIAAGGPSILDGVMCEHLAGASALLDQPNQRIVMRLARSAHAQIAQRLPPPEAA